MIIKVLYKKTMKTIIAGTDFSPSSENACRYAALLADKLSCKLTIFNLFQVPILHTNMGLYGINYNSQKKNSEEKVSNLIMDLRRSFPKININSFVTSGSFSEELEEFTRLHKVEVAVMGLKSKDKISKFLYGSHGVNVAGKINSPVIIVPETYKKHELSEILLSVDNSEKLEKPTLKGLERFVKLTKVKLDILYVRTPDEIFNPVVKALKINNEKMDVEIIKSKDINTGIDRYRKEKGSDLIAIISKHHSIFYNMFSEVHTKKIAFAAKVPVMAIHE